MTLLIADKLPVITGDKLICDSLSLELEPGDRIGIIGPNGCGKTSVLHTLAGFRKISSGTLTILGSNISKLSRKVIATKLGILQQNLNINFNPTVLEFCAQGRFAHQSNFKFAATAIQEFLPVLELVELDNHIQQKLMSLSGGELKRLQIAQLLIQNPSIYLLDEPTNHLDLRWQSKLLNYFLELSLYGAGFIIAIHDLNLLMRYCNKTVMLLPNEVIQGNTTEVLTSENLSRLYGHRLSLKLQPIWYPEI